MDGGSQKVSRNMRVAVALGISAALIAAFAACTFLTPAVPVSAQAQGVPASRIVFKALAAPLVTIWCYSACRRCTDRFVQHCLVGICVLCLFWILDTLVKYPARDDGIVQMLWYLYYVPIIFIPLLCSHLALHLARCGTGKGFSRYRVISLAVSCALLAMVLTNGLHHFVFAFDLEDSLWSSVYEYGPGYSLVAIWVVGLIVTCPVALLYVARRSLRRAIAFLLVPLSFIGAYALCYALRMPIVFSSSVAMMDTLLVVVTLEAALRLGLIPVQERQREVFSRLPFELGAYDEDGTLCYCTKAAHQRDPGLVAGGPHRVRESVPLSSGYAVVVKDTALVDEKSEKLDAMRARLERQHALLEAEYSVDANVRVQQELADLYDEVSGSVSRGVERACALLDEIPVHESSATIDEQGDGLGARWRTLAEVKLLLGLCKQKGQCTVDTRRTAAFAGDYLRLVTTEACANMRPLGIECAVLLEVEELSVHELLTLLDELYAWGIALLDDGATVVARVAGDEGHPGLRLRMMIECPHADDALVRRKLLGSELGMAPSETASALGEAVLSVSVPLDCNGGTR